MYRKYAVFFVLFLIYLISVFVRFQILDHRAKAYGSLPFSNESAPHFIYTKIIAETGSLPVVDNKIQYPEGINIRKKNFVFMEYFYGYLYRISTFLGKFQLTSFIRHIIPLLFSLSIIAVFILAYSVSKNKIAALISSAYYGIMLPSVLGTTGEITGSLRFYPGAGRHGWPDGSLSVPVIGRGEAAGGDCQGTGE